MKDESITSKLLFAKNALTNSLGNDTIKSSLALLGYEDVKLKEGQKTPTDC